MIFFFLSLFPSSESKTVFTNFGMDIDDRFDYFVIAFHDPEVEVKKDRTIKYCKVATEYNLANGYKGFKYLFIPHDEISSSSSFNNLM